MATLQEWEETALTVRPILRRRSSGRLGRGVPPLHVSLYLSPFISKIWTWRVSLSSSAQVSLSESKSSVHSSKGRLVVIIMEPRHFGRTPLSDPPLG